MAARGAFAALALLALAAAAPAELRDRRDELAHNEAEQRATATAIELITARIERNEARVDALERRIADLGKVRGVQLARLAERQQEVLHLIGALQTLSRRPPALLLAQPQSAVDAARVSLLLETLMPRLRARTAGLRAQIGETAATRAQLTTERLRLGKAQAALARDIRQLEREGERLAARAGSLRELVDGLSRHTATVMPQLALLTPAEGRLMRRFGAPNAVGVPAQGLSWRTAPGALVLAPADGRVAFTGPFGTYGRIVIIEHGRGVVSLLSGLGGARVSTGQRVRRGAIVGLMGDRNPTLYLEIRSGGSPVDPQPWLRKSSQG